MTKSQGLNIGYLDRRKKLDVRGIGFLVYFLPLFSIKMLGKDITDNIGMIITVLAVLCSIVNFRKLKNPHNMLWLWGGLLGLGLVTIITTGKFSIFFSIYTLFLLGQVKKENLSRIYKLLLITGIGLLAFTLIRYYGNDIVQRRFMNGVYVQITKRSNFIYVAYFAVVNLCLLYKKKIKP